MDDIEQTIEPFLDAGIFVFEDLEDAWRTLTWRTLGAFKWGYDARVWKECWMAFHVAAQNVFNEWIGEEDLKDGERFGKVDLYGLFENLRAYRWEYSARIGRMSWTKDFVDSLRKHRVRRDEAKREAPQQSLALYARDKVKKAADARMSRGKDSSALYSAGRSPGDVRPITTMSEIPEVPGEGTATDQVLASPRLLSSASRTRTLPPMWLLPGRRTFRKMS
ncbi:hypothetical protein QFC20_005790 [Naganishia adeliensis]|uniref:Uncharacterized protein n=1 Tax=Naganishia adeliensis TaxID=92952 RepID=A0ACC2VKF5_9TREE|nr:hypothetical protein QFC20_005790 [Naganishia adeliensis]